MLRQQIALDGICPNCQFVVIEDARVFDLRLIGRPRKVVPLDFNDGQGRDRAGGGIWVRDLGDGGREKAESETDCGQCIARDAPALK